MARSLYALGSWSSTHRRRVLAAWLLLLVVVGGLGGALHGELSTVFSVPGIESQNAQSLLASEFPAAAGGSARVVFQAPSGTTLTAPDVQSALAASLRAASRVPGVVAVTDPAATAAVSADGTIGYSDVVFGEIGPAVPQSAKDALQSAMAPAHAAGVTVEFGGTAMAATSPIGGPGEIVGLVVAFVVLALALSSLVAAGLPLLTAFVGVAIGVLGVEFVSRFLDLTTTATVLAVMIGLAVGIDYALFIVSRHREQLRDPDQDVEDSVARAVGTAGSAVVFAGTTVIIALVSFAAAGIPFLTVMGLAAAGTVLLAVLVAVTLVPAVLGFAGERLRPRSARAGVDGSLSAARVRRPGAGVVWARGIARAPVLVLVVGVLALLAIALPARHLRLGLPSNETQPVTSTQHASYDLLTRGFGAGVNATLAVVVDARGIPVGTRPAVFSTLSATLRRDPGVAQVGPPIANQAGTVVVVNVVPRTGPDDAATGDLVRRLRSDDRTVVDEAGGTQYVAGATATDIDVSAKLSSSLPLFVAIIVVLAFVLLAIAFRSLLVPLTAVVGFLLSVAAGLGVVVAVFQDGRLDSVFGVVATAPVVSFVPVLLIGVLFGLAMDYEVFLVSRMRESWEQDRDAGRAVVDGVGRSGRVVAAAALIMAAVFAGFVFTPDPIIKSIAVALTVGVLFDAFVVRLTLVPAAMTLLGRHAWGLPGWLDRLVPDVDIEGASLPPRRPAVAPAAEPVTPVPDRTPAPV